MFVELPATLLRRARKPESRYSFPIIGNVSTVSCVKELLYYFVVAVILKGGLMPEGLNALTGTGVWSIKEEGINKGVVYPVSPFGSTSCAMPSLRRFEQIVEIVRGFYALMLSTYPV